MTPEELLKPRYKVIADWPARQFMAGAILHLDEPIPDGRIRVWIEHEKQKERYLWNPEENNHFDDYPHLFQKLEWWQERKPEEMPRYLKDKSGNKVYSVYKHFSCTYPQAIRTGESDFFDDPNCWLREHDYAQNYSFYLPATLEEYNQYQSSIKHL